MKFKTKYFSICIICCLTISCKTVNSKSTEQPSNNLSVETPKINTSNKTDVLQEIHESTDAVLTPSK